MNDVLNVTAGKPDIAGAIWVAPIGTTVPTSTDEALSEAFKCLGYCSEDGLTNTPNMENASVKAWGGDTVLNTITSKDDQFGYTLIESTNVDVLKHIYGKDNVSGDLDAGIHIKVKNFDTEEFVMVIDMVLRNGNPKRIVIPDGKVVEVGEITYNDSDPTGFETTLSCMPDEEGITHHEYIKKKASVSA